MLGHLHCVDRDPVSRLPGCCFGDHERDDLLLHREGESGVNRAHQDVRVVVSCLCAAAALLMVLGQVVPALRAAQVTVWLGVLTLLVAALVTTVVARRRRGR
jgi:hypothetical protein